MSAAAEPLDWEAANQQHLLAELGRVREALRTHAGEEPAADQPCGTVELPAPSALDTLSTAFGLSDFERDVVLLCAGIELDAGFAELCASAQSDPLRPFPTFGLALAALPGAHWSALGPDGPLRRWRLVELPTGENLTSAPLRIDERVLHYLTGVPAVDERLRGLVKNMPDKPMTSSREVAVSRVLALWQVRDDAGPPPAVQLCGPDAAGRLAVAGAACARVGLTAALVDATVVPESAAEREALARLWEREAALSAAALVLEVDLDDAARVRRVVEFALSVGGFRLVSAAEPLRSRHQALLRVDVPALRPAEQLELWAVELNSQALAESELAAVAQQFRLGGDGVAAAAARIRAGASAWDACREQARPGLDDLALRIEAVAGWDDLVLPEPQKRVLHEIALHVRHRATVYEDWGFAGLGARGLGISALFAGPSGTGKTMAAEVLANELRLDLYRIDLSSVVSKYIGETEKNLRRVFDAAEEGGAILLFDEADALFGKRSEVKDSHDRYANIEISYLLQRMEAYRGLAILTTNIRSALDQAFLRRLRFVVQFPFPDAAHRAEIWRRIFPDETPTGELDHERLARLNLPGGNIRNIALGAAFLAADEQEPVGMSQLLRAARGEYAKLEKPLSGTEVEGWS